MGYATERQTIETRFNTQWASASPIAWDNVSYTPTTGTSWVRFSILSGAAFQASLETTPKYRHTGIIDIGIFTPEDGGTQTARTLADTAAAVFRGWSSGGIVCRAPYITRIGQSDGWYQLNVTVPFYRDEAF